MTDTYDPSEQLVVRVLRLQIEGGHLWLDPAGLTEDMITRWFGVSRATAVRVLQTLNHEQPGQDATVDGSVRMPPVQPSPRGTQPRPTASTITDADLDLLYAELARLRLQSGERRSVP